MIKEILSEEQWNTFVLKQTQYTFIQSWAWGEFMNIMGYKVFRIGYFSDDTLRAVCQGNVVYAKRGRFLHLRHMPVVPWEDTSVSRALMDEVVSIALKENVSFIRMSPLVKTIPDIQSATTKKLVPSSMHDVDAEHTWVLDITPSEEELLANMRKNTRYSIKKAEKDGVVVESMTDDRYKDVFFSIFYDTVERNKYTGYSREYIWNGYKTFAQKGQARMYIAKYRNTPIAAAIFNYFGGKSFYYHSGHLTKYRKVPASYAIQWQAIKDEKQYGMDTHNFWGIAPLEKEEGSNSKVVKNHPWSGLSYFKVGFGGESLKFIHAQDIPLSVKWYGTHFYGMFERFRSGF